MRTDPKAEVQAAALSEGWTPDPQRVYEWSVLDNANGSSTLVIQACPFFYRPLTLDAQFCRDFGFDIESITSTVEIDLLALDKPAYDRGESVSVSLEVSSTGTLQDVII